MNTASSHYRSGNVFLPRLYGFAFPPTTLYEHLLEPWGEPPPDLWFPTPRFSPQPDLCLVVGLEKRFRSVRKCAPKVRSYSRPKIRRTRWAPIMGAHLVRSLLGPENDPTFGAHFRTDLNRFSSPTTKHQSSRGENLGVGNHSSGGGSPHGSSRCSYKIIGGKANPYILGKNTLPLR